MVGLGGDIFQTKCLVVGGVSYHLLARVGLSWRPYGRYVQPFQFLKYYIKVLVHYGVVTLGAIEMVSNMWRNVSEFYEIIEFIICFQSTSVRQDFPTQK
jgi:hypothetical protein